MMRMGKYPGGDDARNAVALLHFGAIAPEPESLSIGVKLYMLCGLVGIIWHGQASTIVQRDPPEI